MVKKYKHGQKEYVITMREVQDKWYNVIADSKQTALQLIEEWECDYDNVTWVRDYKPVVREVKTWVNCPNKGNGYTDVAQGIEPGSWDWHYNGKCDGVMVEGNEHGTCYNCHTHMGAGNPHAGQFRWLTEEEKQYLMDKYGDDESLTI